MSKYLWVCRDRNGSFCFRIGRKNPEWRDEPGWWKFTSVNSRECSKGISRLLPDACIPSPGHAICVDTERRVVVDEIEGGA